MKGDADIYLNYGESLPTSKKYDWKSNQINHEFIDINKNNEFFISRNITSLKGFYTLLVAGFIDTSYTLFISNHKNVIFINDITHIFPIFTFKNSFVADYYVVH